MFDWGGLINTAVQVGGEIGGKAVEGSFAKQQAEIIAQGQSSQGLMQQVASLGNAGWDAVANGYMPAQIYATQLGQREITRASIEKQKIEAEANQKQTMLIVALAAAALVIGAIVLLNKQ